MATEVHRYASQTKTEIALQLIKKQATSSPHDPFSPYRHRCAPPWWHVKHHEALQINGEGPRARLNNDQSKHSRLHGEREDGREYQPKRKPGCLIKGISVEVVWHEPVTVVERVKELGR